jgi:hypothetical protein
LIALAAVAILYQFSQLPFLSHSEAAELASRFRFAKLQFPELQGYPRKLNRAVNPSLKRISAWISSVGAAVALGDLDADGLPNDLCYVDPRTDLVTIAPAPGTPARYQPFALNFTGIAYDAGATAPMGCLIGDFNEDGLMDALVYFWGRTPIVFLRQVTADASQDRVISSSNYVPFDVVPTQERWYTSAATMADLDGDGHTDIIIGNYFQDGARILDEKAESADQLYDAKGKSFNGGWKHLLLWAGNSGGPQPTPQFKEAKGVLEEKIARGWTLAIGAADLDGDMLPEIYFANDFGPDRLLRNLSTPGNLRFELLEGRMGFATPASFATGNDSFKGMGVDFGDINGDGLPDIFVSNITSQYALQESNFLWLSTGEVDLMKKGIAPYKQMSEPLGLSRGGWSWDCRIADFDCDGVAEAIQATGFIKGEVNRWPELQSLGTANSQIMSNPWYWPGFKPGDDLSGRESNPFFARGKDGKYHDISSELGLDDQMVSRGIAIADVDGDKRLDFAIANQWETSFFYHNESPDVGAFLGLRLFLPLDTSNSKAQKEHPGAHLPGRPAIGALATVHLPDDTLLTAQVDGGSGHSGKRSPDLNFGLGRIEESMQLQIDIEWRAPGGEIRKKTLFLPSGWHTILLD